MKNDILYPVNNEDTFKLLPRIPDKCIDVIITDPPYDLYRQEMIWLHKHFYRVARSAIIVFSPPENPWEFRDALILDDNYLEYPTMPDHYLFWQKPISTKNTSKSYSRFVEMIFVYELEDYVWNTNRNWANYTNVFNDIVEGISGHPFEKPLSLIRRIILNHTNEGDIILDPFMGSGTTIICARELNRYSYGIDSDKDWTEYVEQKLTNLPTLTDNSLEV